MEICACQAKIHLLELLTKVAQGELITITRNGRAIARLVSVETLRKLNVRGVIDEMKTLAKGRRAGFPIREMIAGGRR